MPWRNKIAFAQKEYYMHLKGLWCGTINLAFFSGSFLLQLGYSLHFLILFADFLYGFGCLVKRGPLRSLEVAREYPSCFAIISQKALKMFSQWFDSILEEYLHYFTRNIFIFICGNYLSEWWVDLNVLSSVCVSVYFYQFFRLQD